MNKFVWIFFLCSTAYSVNLKWRAETNSRFYWHTRSPMDTASHRHFLDLEATFKEGPFWTLHAGGKGYVEGAFSGNESRYGADIRRKESSDIRLKDTFLQYKSGGWTIRGGNQTVVWGEAFGFYYADFLNPKDLRELGIGPLERNRVSIPMLSTKFVSQAFSVQVVGIPKPYFHLTPAQGGDFSFPFDAFFPGFTVDHVKKINLELKGENFEGAMRVSSLIGSWDLALILGYYFDRSPVYESVFTSASEVSVVDRHDRVKTVGLTSSVPCGPFICRGEFLFHKDKYFNAFQAPHFVPEKSDEFVAVVGIDYTQSDRYHLGLQFSENLRSVDSTFAIAPKSQQNLSLHVRAVTFMNQKFETILSFLPHDSSFLIQAQYLIPLSDRMEFLLTSDTFLGNSNSQFGQYQRASRAGGIFKIYLSGE